MQKALKNEILLQAELKKARQENEELKVATETAERLMRALLFQWLAKDTQAKVRRFVKYYHTEARLEMYYAMLRYVLTGKVTKFKNGCAQWHFHLFCEDVELDRVTNEPHKHLVRLWNEVGLLIGME